MAATENFVKVRNAEGGVHRLERSALQGVGADMHFPIIYDDGTYTYALTASGGSIQVKVFLDADPTIYSQADAWIDGTQGGHNLVAHVSGHQTGIQPITEVGGAVSYIDLSTDSQHSSLFVWNSGNPNGTITAVKGSLLIDKSGPTLYLNTNGATAWSAVGSGGGGTNYWKLATVAGGTNNSLQVNNATTTGLDEIYAYVTAAQTTFLYLSDFGTGPSSCQADLRSAGSASVRATGGAINIVTTGAGHHVFVSSSDSLFLYGQNNVQINGAGNLDILNALTTMQTVECQYTIRAQETMLNSSVGGATTLDLNWRIHNLTLGSNVTSLAFTNVPSTGQGTDVTFYLKQDATGSRTVAWPASFKWPGGIAPILSTAGLATDIVVAQTLDGGTTWYANLAGKAYA